MIPERRFREDAVIAVRGEYLPSIGPFFMRWDRVRKSSRVHASRQTVEALKMWTEKQIPRPMRKPEKAPALHKHGDVRALAGLQLLHVLTPSSPLMSSQPYQVRMSREITLHL